MLVMTMLVMTAGMQGTLLPRPGPAIPGEFDEQARWRVPRPYTKVAVPSRAAWNAGRRWFDCDVIPRSGEHPFLFTGTAGGALSPARPPAVRDLCRSHRRPAHRLHAAAPGRAANAVHPADPVAGLKARDVPGHTALRGAPPADHRTTRPDPTFGGRSVITDHIQPVMRSCWVVTVDGTQLTGGLVGHGDRPLAGG